MKPSLIFHIGAHRTATSAVQEYLYRNIPALKQRGYLYPFMVRRHVHTINHLFNGTRSPKEVAGELQERIAAHEMELHTIVLSDEDICMRQDLRVLGKLKKWFNVKVVFTLRRQDLWLESWYLQNIKWQWNPKLSHCSLPEFLQMREDFHWIHYDRYVRHLEDVFGRGNVIVNPYERGQMPSGGAVQMFCDSIGLKPDENFVAPATVNPSFSPQVSEFMRCLPLDKAPEPYRGVLTAACARIDANRVQTQEGGGAPLLISHEERLAIMALYEPGNRALAQRYFDRDDLFLNPLPDPATPLQDMSLPADSYQLMAEFVGPLLQAVIAHRREEINHNK